MSIVLCLLQFEYSLGSNVGQYTIQVPRSFRFFNHIYKRMELLTGTFRSIIPYWPELFRSIIPYWPELFRSIIPYWPEQVIFYFFIFFSYFLFFLGRGCRWMNWRQPKWKTSKMEDDQTERRPKWKMTKMKDNQKW